ncbi:ribosome modulation factor [Paraburkholderia phenoliruptrix]|uniref:ribosome modulation factor n=1 Tax=Paraburkholderia phenoliruptrix TaxID=252970 RepID=UPI00285B87E4|nr:Rmf/CrpP family protein [Paraburkholderia phenoliruptrix]MDR6393043.1 ribosome modulation factor [Paraburkholderia phenoliruptrix]
MLTRQDIETLMREGSEAFERGMSKNVCPYPVMSAAFATWMRGYQNAAYGAAQLEKHHV